MMMIIIIMIIASYIMVMIIIILTASYIGDDVRIVYALANTMRYFLVTDQPTNKGILGVGWRPLDYHHRKINHIVMMYYVPIGPTSILHMIAFSPHLAIIISVKLYMRKINGIGGNIVMRDIYLHYCIFTTGKYIFILTLTSISGNRCF